MELLELLTAPVTPPQGGGRAESLPAVSAVAAGSGAYEGASVFDQMQLWQPPIQSADLDILPEKDMLDSRVLDVLRNDAFINGGATLHKDNIVGSIYLLNAKPMTKILWGKEDETWEQEFQEEVETKFMLTAESGRCWLDAQGTKTLTDHVRLGVHSFIASGEDLLTAEWGPDDGRPCRTSIQSVDPVRLSDPATTYFTPEKIRGGVEIDTNGRPVAYHFRVSHPHDYGWRMTNTSEWRRVMARKPWGRPMVLHTYEQTRPGQTRGISPMVGALQEIKMLKKFRKVDLQRAVLAATYAASIESELPSHEVYRLLGGDQQIDNPAIEYMKQYLQAIGQYAGGAKGLAIDGVKIPVMMPGTKLNLKNPGAESPSGSEFEMSMLRYVAAALGVSYEQLSRDYTKTNYSSARASRGETEKHMASRKKLVADAHASFAYTLWLEERINANDLECLKRRNVPNFYESLNREAYTACDWLGAGAGMIDPLKEMQAHVLALNNKIGTRERVIARLYGSDWRRELRQIAREEKAFEAAGIILPQDAQQDMQNSLTAAPRDASNVTSAALRSEIESVLAEMLEVRT